MEMDWDDHALYHFSHEPGIERFEPRAPLKHPDAPALVWAIDAYHSPLYLLPRDCPRVAFWPISTTTEEDRERWFPDASLRMTIAIEAEWLERAMDLPLYRYSLPVNTFASCEDHGCSVSEVGVAPLVLEKVDKPLAVMAEMATELRVLPSLVPLARRVMDTSLHFSMIRMRNAVGWDGPAGTPTISHSI